VAADGPHQTNNFRNGLFDCVGLTDYDDKLSLPITWDTAHLLDLSVADVRDSDSPSGEFFKLVIKHCNVFNHVLSHG